MTPSLLCMTLLGLAVLGYYLGQHRAQRLAIALGGIRKLSSLPSYYGGFVAAMTLLPAILVAAIWLIADDTVIVAKVESSLPQQLRELNQQDLGLLMNSIRNVAPGSVAGPDTPETHVAAAKQLRHLQSRSMLWISMIAVAVALCGGLGAWLCIKPRFVARIVVERLVTVALFVSASIAVLTTLGILLSVLFESMRFFELVPLGDFLFGTTWSPQIALRADQQGSSGQFGVVPLFAGTLLISAIALLVAVPVGLMSAIFLSEYAGRRWRNNLKPLLEILAGIPTVVYGFFAALTVAPFIRDLGARFDLSVSSESALAAGLVMGVMIIPFVSSLSDDIIHAVPQSMRDGSLAMGATRSETVTRVIVPAALPGIVGGVLLAASRAIGETMIVVMAAGLSARLTANPLESVTTVTVQIVTLLVGDQEFDSPKTLAAFALGLLLFLTTLVLNIVALHIVRKYREQYE